MFVGRVPDEQGRRRPRLLQCLGQQSPAPRGPTQTWADVSAQTGLSRHVEHDGGPAGREYSGHDGTLDEPESGTGDDVRPDRDHVERRVRGLLDDLAVQA